MLALLACLYQKGRLMEIPWRLPFCLYLWVCLLLSKSMFFCSLLQWLVLESGAAVVEDGQQVGGGLGAQHGDARLAEVGDALEDGRGRQVATGVQNAAVLVDALHIDAQLLLEDVDLVVEGEREGWWVGGLVGA